MTAGADENAAHQSPREHDVNELDEEGNVIAVFAVPSKMTAEDTDRMMEYLDNIRTSGRSVDDYMIGVASLEVIQSIMRLREKKRNPPYFNPRQAKWFGSENGQTLRTKNEFKSKRPVRLPKNLKQTFEIEVHLQVQPPASATQDN